MGTLDGNKKMRRAGSCCQASENSTCSPLMEYPVPINSLLNLSRILTPIKRPIKRQGRAFIFLFAELPLPRSLHFMGEPGLAKVSRFSNEFRGPGVYIDLLVYRGLGFGLNCQALAPASGRERGRLKAGDRETGTDRQTGEEEANIHRRNVAAGWCCRGNLFSQTQCEASDTEGSLATTTRRWRGVSNTNAGKPGPQRAPGYLNDDSNGL